MAGAALIVDTSDVVARQLRLDARADFPAGYRDGAHPLDYQELEHPIVPEYVLHTAVAHHARLLFRYITLSELIVGEFPGIGCLRGGCSAGLS